MLGGGALDWHPDISATRGQLHWVCGMRIDQDWTRQEENWGRTDNVDAAYTNSGR